MSKKTPIYAAVAPPSSAPSDKDEKMPAAEDAVATRASGSVSKKQKPTVSIASVISALTKRTAVDAKGKTDTKHTPTPNGEDIDFIDLCASDNETPAPAVVAVKATAPPPSVADVDDPNRTDSDVDHSADSGSGDNDLGGDEDEEGDEGEGEDEDEDDEDDEEDSASSDDDAGATTTTDGGFEFSATDVERYEIAARRSASARAEKLYLKELNEEAGRIISPDTIKSIGADVLVRRVQERARAIADAALEKSMEEFEERSTSPEALALIENLADLKNEYGLISFRSKGNSEETAAELSEAKADVDRATKAVQDFMRSIIPYISKDDAFEPYGALQHRGATMLRLCDSKREMFLSENPDAQRQNDVVDDALFARVIKARGRSDRKISKQMEGFIVEDDADTDEKAHAQARASDLDFEKKEAERAASFAKATAELAAKKAAEVDKKAAAYAEARRVRTPSEIDADKKMCLLNGSVCCSIHGGCVALMGFECLYCNESKRSTEWVCAHEWRIPGKGCSLCSNNLLQKARLSAKTDDERNVVDAAFRNHCATSGCPQPKTKRVLVAAKAAAAKKEAAAKAAAATKAAEAAGSKRKRVIVPEAVVDTGAKEPAAKRVCADVKIPSAPAPVFTAAATAPAVPRPSVSGSATATSVTDVLNSIEAQVRALFDKHSEKLILRSAGLSVDMPAIKRLAALFAPDA